MSGTFIFVIVWIFTKYSVARSLNVRDSYLITHKVVLYDNRPTNFVSNSIVQQTIIFLTQMISSFKLIWLPKINPFRMKGRLFQIKKLLCREPISGTLNLSKNGLKVLLIYAHIGWLTQRVARCERTLLQPQSREKSAQKLFGNLAICFSIVFCAFTDPFYW